MNLIELVLLTIGSFIVGFYLSKVMVMFIAKIPPTENSNPIKAEAWVVDPKHSVTMELFEFDDGDIIRAYHSEVQFLAQAKNMERLIEKLKDHYHGSTTPALIKILDTDQYAVLQNDIIETIDNIQIAEEDK